MAPLATATLKGPHVDFAGLSPLIALLGGAAIVLLVGLLGSQRARAQAVPDAQPGRCSRVALGLTIWQWGEQKSIVAGALRIDDLSLLLNIVLIAGGAATVLLAWRSRAAQSTRPRRVARAAVDLDRRHVPAGERPEHGARVPRPGASVDPAVRALRDRTAQSAASTRSARWSRG